MINSLRLKAMGSLVVTVLLAGATTSVTPPDSPVADAAQGGDTKALRTLISQGEDVNAPHGDGMTALHWAAERGDLEMTNLLIYAGANLRAGTRIGNYAPLHLASKAGTALVVEALLEAGSPVDPATTTTGVQPIHMGAESGNAEVIRALLEHGADANARELSWGHTPLVFAASQNRTDAIQVLVEFGADPSLHSWPVDIDRRTEVDGKAKQRLDEVLLQFRGQEAAEDEDWTPSPEQVQAAVRAARRVQQADEVEEQDEPKTPGAVGGWGGLNPLLHAVRAAHVEATLTLLDAGVDINAVSDGDGTSPLLIAAVNGHFDLAMTLLERGADPNVASDAGATALYAAINLEWAPKSRYAQPRSHEFQNTTYLELMEALLEAGADPNTRLSKDLWYKWSGRSGLGATAFWRAAYGTDVAAMRLLVAYGADAGVATLKGPDRRPFGRPNTAPQDSVPADSAAAVDEEEEDEEEKLDPSGLAKVPEGGPSTYPIHAASGVGYGENYSEGNVHRHAPGGWLTSITYLVEEMGADVNARDQNGYTALHHAASRGDIDVLRYLVEKGADVTVVSRKGQTPADMANSPGQRLPVHPIALEYLESLGVVNNDNCFVCQ
jgi:ankyrin repeat protein